MRILMLTPYVPYPPASGGQIRTLNLLKYLKKNHAITLVALYKNEDEKKHIKYLKQYCSQIYLCKRAKNPWQLTNVAKSIFSFLPFLIVRNFSQEAKKTISQLLKTEIFDVIHAETFYIMPHIPKTAIPVLLVEQTIEYKVYQHFVNSLPFFIRPFFYLDILKLSIWERHFWKKADLVVAVSQSDETIIKKLEPLIKTTVVPNGAGDEMISEKVPLKNLNKPMILFQGNFNWLQNVEAANFLIKRIYPKLHRSMPKIKFVISGQNAIKITSPKKSGITIIDIKSNDLYSVKKLFNQATLFLAPIFGPGGTRLKILAAMAAGVPVISTPVGIEGLEITDGKHCLIANNEREFTRSIREILANRRKYESIQREAHDLVREKYNWRIITHELELYYQNIKLQ